MYVQCAPSQLPEEHTAQAIDAGLFILAASDNYFCRVMILRKVGTYRNFDVKLVNVQTVIIYLFINCGSACEKLQVLMAPIRDFSLWIVPSG
jgi:hypothetical protein